MEEVEISLLLSAGWGHGTLFYEGTHAFKLKGLGVGGLGVSKLEAYGNVFRLTKLSDFSGAYGAAQLGRWRATRCSKADCGWRTRPACRSTWCRAAAGLP